MTAVSITAIARTAGAWVVKRVSPIWARSTVGASATTAEDASGELVADETVNTRPASTGIVQNNPATIDWGRRAISFDSSDGRVINSENTINTTKWVIGHFEERCTAAGVTDVMVPMVAEFVKTHYGIDYYSPALPMQTVMRRPLMIVPTRLTPSCKI